MKYKPLVFVLFLFACAPGMKAPEKSSKVLLPFSEGERRAAVYTTSQGSKDFIAHQGNLDFRPSSQPLETEVFVLVDPSKQYQAMLGIGGALTDASAETFARIPVKAQQELLRAYFDPQSGIGYTMARTNINSCDFSSASYTYVADGDSSLKTFSVAHDEKFKIPFIQAAFKASGNKLNFFVSPWSPPAWMKDNNNMLQGGKLKPEFYQTWANYYVKFIQEYEKRGMPVWGLTVQNEPMAKQRWESCIYTAEEERDFIKNYLGPTLEKGKLGDKKLIAWDHNRDLIYHRASTILTDPDAAKYVWGIGFHWYETWTGSAMQFDNLKNVSQSFPDKNLIFTEGCVEKFSFDRLGDWSLGEKYAHSMINDFNSGTVAWTDWNILLDENGGPNHVGNFCFAPVHANTKTGELIFTNSYYYIGHFSKFIRPGARRVLSSSNRDKLETISFLNNDGSLVVVVLNRSESDISYRLMVKDVAATSVSSAHSISTLVIK